MNEQEDCGCFTDSAVVGERCVCTKPRGHGGAHYNIRHGFTWEWTPAELVALTAPSTVEKIRPGGFDKHADAEAAEGRKLTHFRPLTPEEIAAGRAAAKKFEDDRAWERARLGIEATLRHLDEHSIKVDPEAVKSCERKWAHPYMGDTVLGLDLALQPAVGTGILYFPEGSSTEWFLRMLGKDYTKDEVRHALQLLEAQRASAVCVPVPEVRERAGRTSFEFCYACACERAGGRMCSQHEHTSPTPKTESSRHVTGSAADLFRGEVLGEVGAWPERKDWKDAPIKASHFKMYVFTAESGATFWYRDDMLSPAELESVKEYYVSKGWKTDVVEHVQHASSTPNLQNLPKRPDGPVARITEEGVQDYVDKLMKDLTNDVQEAVRNESGVLVRAIQQSTGDVKLVLENPTSEPINVRLSDAELNRFRGEFFDADKCAVVDGLVTAGSFTPIDNLGQMK